MSLNDMAWRFAKKSAGVKDKQPSFNPNDGSGPVQIGKGFNPMDYKSLGKNFTFGSQPVGKSVNSQNNQPNYQTPFQPQANPNQGQQQGVNGYNPTTAPFGMDQTNPGVTEQFWNQNQNMWFGGPSMDWVNQSAPSNQNQGSGAQAFGPAGAGQQFWNQVQGKFNDYSKDLTPQFDQFWDRATDKAIGASESAAAARGSYGSSQQLNNVGNVAADMNAQRAKEASNFALQNAKNQREALGTFGNLAFNASGEDLQYDQQGLNRLNAGFNAAQAADASRRARTQDAFGNNMQYLNTMLPFLQGNYNGIFDSDANLMGAGIDSRLGKTANDLAQSQRNQNRLSNDLGTALQIPGAIKDGKDAGIW
jgi:hypothetical protein